jgi:ACS family tartrate transporter-like MFS transporter
VLFCLPDRPRHAKWLTAEERDALESDLEADRASRPASHHISVLASLRHPKVILLAGVLFTISASNYALETFLPSILKKWYGLSTDSVTTLLLLPPVCALLGQLVVAWSSDRTGERRIHAAVCTFLAGFGFVTAPMTHGMLPLTLACFMLYATGNKASQVPFWALPSLMLTGSAAAASTGLINSIGNLGGFIGPTILGKLEAHVGSFIPGLYALGVLLILASISLVLLKLTHVPHDPRGFAVVLPGGHENGLTTSSPATTLPGKSSE